MGHFYLMIRTVRRHLLVIFNTQVYWRVICQVTDKRDGLRSGFNSLIYTTIDRLYTCLPNLAKKEGTCSLVGKESVDSTCCVVKHQVQAMNIELILKVGFDDH